MIGIVGGVGPLAGVDLLGKVFQNTLAESDQDHLDVVLLSMSSKIEDRTEYLIGNAKDNPGTAIVEVLLKLEKAGAIVAGIPCNTAHSEEIFSVIQSGLAEANSTISVLNMIKETSLYIAHNFPAITKIGVLSTTGTYISGVYSKALAANGFEIIVPSMEIQEELIHPAIYHPTYGIKTKFNPILPQARKNLLKSISFLKNQGAQAIILGCTEIPLVLTEARVNGLVSIDPSNVLARALIRAMNPDKLKPL